MNKKMLEIFLKERRYVLTSSDVSPIKEYEITIHGNTSYFSGIFHFNNMWNFRIFQSRIRTLTFEFS